MVNERFGLGRGHNSFQDKQENLDGREGLDNQEPKGAAEPEQFPPFNKEQAEQQVAEASHDGGSSETPEWAQKTVEESRAKVKEAMKEDDASKDGGEFANFGFNGTKSAQQEWQENRARGKRSMSVEKLSGAMTQAWQEFREEMPENTPKDSEKYASMVSRVMFDQMNREGLLTDEIGQIEEELKGISNANPEDRMSGLAIREYITKRAKELREGAAKEDEFQIPQMPSQASEARPVIGSESVVIPEPMPQNVAQSQPQPRIQPEVQPVVTPVMQEPKQSVQMAGTAPITGQEAPKVQEKRPGFWKRLWRGDSGKRKSTGLDMRGPGVGAYATATNAVWRQRGLNTTSKSGEREVLTPDQVGRELRGEVSENDSSEKSAVPIVENIPKNEPEKQPEPQDDAKEKAEAEERKALEELRRKSDQVLYPASNAPGDFLDFASVPMPKRSELEKMWEEIDSNTQARIVFDTFYNKKDSAYYANSKVVRDFVLSKRQQAEQGQEAA